MRPCPPPPAGPPLLHTHAFAKRIAFARPRLPAYKILRYFWPKTAVGPAPPNYTKAAVATTVGSRGPPHLHRPAL